MSERSEPGVRAVPTKHRASATYTNLKVSFNQTFFVQLLASSCREPFLCRVLPPEHCWLFGAPGVLRMGEGVQEKRGARERVLGSFQVRKMSLPSRESSTSWKRQFRDWNSSSNVTWVSAFLQSASLIIKTGVSPCEDAAKAVEDEERGEETLHCSDGVLSNKTTALHPAWTGVANCVFGDKCNWSFRRPIFHV